MSRGEWLRSVEHVLAVAGVILLCQPLWHGESSADSRMVLTTGERRAYASRATKPLVFAGEYSDTIAVFIDYLCAYCAAIYSDIARIGAPYGLELRHAVANPYSPRGLTAVASECAREQERFHAYNYALFSKRDSIHLVSWGAFGKAAGVPRLLALDECIDLRRPIEVVALDARLAAALAIRATPTAIHRGMIYEGPVRIYELISALVASR